MCGTPLHINGRLLDLRVRGRGTYDLKGSIKRGFRVGPRSADRGLANELARLERAARSGSKARWIRAWAAVSPRCRDLVWHPAPPPVVKREFDEGGRLISFERVALQEEMVGIDGVLIGPRPANVLAAIVEARRNLAATNRDDRRGNKRNDAADAIAATIRAAVFDLTGRIGFTRDPVDGYVLRSARRAWCGLRCALRDPHLLAADRDEIDEFHMLARTKRAVTIVDHPTNRVVDDGHDIQNTLPVASVKLMRS